MQKILLLKKLTRNSLFHIALRRSPPKLSRPPPCRSRKDLNTRIPKWFFKEKCKLNIFLLCRLPVPESDEHWPCEPPLSRTSSSSAAAAVSAPVVVVQKAAPDWDKIVFIWDFAVMYVFKFNFFTCRPSCAQSLTLGSRRRTRTGPARACQPMEKQTEIAIKPIPLINKKIV